MFLSFNSKICQEKSKFLDRLDDLLKLFGTKDQCQKPLGDKITTKPSRIIKHHSAVPSLNSCPTITRFCVCTVCMRLVDHVENLGTGEARRSCEVIVIQDVVVVVIIILVVIVAAAVAVVVVAVGDADVGGCNDSKLDLEFKTVCTAR